MTYVAEKTFTISRLRVTGYKLAKANYEETITKDMSGFGGSDIVFKVTDSGGLHIEYASDNVHKTWIFSTVSDVQPQKVSQWVDSNTDDEDYSHETF